MTRRSAAEGRFHVGDLSQKRRASAARAFPHSSATFGRWKRGVHISPPTRGVAELLSVRLKRRIRLFRSHQARLDPGSPGLPASSGRVQLGPEPGCPQRRRSEHRSRQSSGPAPPGSSRGLKPSEKSGQNARSALDLQRGSVRARRKLDRLLHASLGLRSGSGWPQRLISA